MKNWKDLWQDVLNETIHRKYRDRVLSSVEKELALNANPQSAFASRRFAFIRIFALSMGAAVLWWTMGRKTTAPLGEEDLGAMFISENEELMSEENLDMLSELDLLEDLEELEKWQNV